LSALKLQEYGLSVTTLEEVFLRVADGDTDSIVKTNSSTNSSLQLGGADGKTPDGSCRASTPTQSRATQSLPRSVSVSGGTINGDIEEGLLAQPLLQRPMDDTEEESVSASGDFAGLGKLGADSDGADVEEGAAFSVLGQQFVAMMLKRVQYSRRAKMNQCCGTVCPAVALLVGLLLVSIASAQLDGKPVKLVIGSYNGQSPTNEVPFVYTRDAYATSSSQDATSIFRWADGQYSAIDYTARISARVAASADKVQQWPPIDPSDKHGLGAAAAVLYKDGLGIGPSAEGLKALQQLGCNDLSFGYFFPGDDLGPKGSKAEPVEVGWSCGQVLQLASNYICSSDAMDEEFEKRNIPIKVPGLPYSIEPYTRLFTPPAWMDPPASSPIPLPHVVANWTDIRRDCSSSSKPPNGTDPHAVSPPLANPAWILALLQELHDEANPKMGGGYARKAAIYGAFVLPAADKSGSRSPSKEISILHNTSGRHAAPTYLNALADATYKSLTGGKGGIEATNHALPVTKKFRAIVNKILALFATIIIMIAYAFIPSAMVSFIVFERDQRHNSKHQQLLCGANTVVFWLAHFVFDVLNYVFGGMIWNCFSPSFWRAFAQDAKQGAYSAVLQHLFMLLPGPFIWAIVLIKAIGFDAFIEDGAYGAVCCLFFFYGLALTPWCYLVAFGFRQHTTAQIYAVLFAVFSGLVLMITSFIMNIVPSTQHINEQLSYLYYICPPFCLGHGLLQVVIGRDVDVFTGGKLDACNAVLHKCSDGCDAAEVNCLNVTHHNATRCDNEFIGCEKVCVAHISDCLQPKGVFDPSVAGSAIAYMGGCTVVYWVAVVLIDIYSTSGGFTKTGQQAALAVQGEEEDAQAEDEEDVAAEAARVLHGNGEENIVQLVKLKKTYPGGKRAVRGMSYGVRAGECFGFLGINGAGKTTTMKMLTGDELPTSGHATILGHDVVSEQQACRKHMGYCPQFDALLDRLTVREHLELFARIKRAVPWSRVPRLVRLMLKQMQLEQFEHKLAGALSGGNKRKLSVAIAMIGSPPVVFLDEPR
jgi:ABC-type lipoprotein export system ATPase subunit